MACELSNYDTVKILCENGADVSLRNKAGKTPFTSVSNNLLLVKLLKKSERCYFDKNIHTNESWKTNEVHLVNRNFLDDKQ